MYIFLMTGASGVLLFITGWPPLHNTQGRVGQTPSSGWALFITPKTLTGYWRLGGRVGPLHNTQMLTRYSRLGGRVGPLHNTQLPHVPCICER